jgi:hypothetical protein
MSNPLFSDIKYYAMFMGYAHSGHSVVGAVLDAHPNMVIANELHALPKFAENNYDVEPVFEMILENSRAMARHGSRTNTGYNYNIPSLFQGRFERLEVIGDKKGGASAVHHSRHPQVLYRLIQQLGPRLKVLHVVRNPYDNISAYAYRLNQPVDPELITGYFRRVDAVLDCQSRLPDQQFHTLHYEDLVRDSEHKMLELCKFLGQDASRDYLDACGAALYKLPHERRRSTPWSERDIRLTDEKMRSAPYDRFFDRYGF